MLVEQVRREPFAGFSVVGVCLPAGQPYDPDGKVPVLGSLDETLDVVRAVAADTVAVTASPEVTPALLRKIAWSLEGSGVDLIVAPAVTDVAGPRISVRPVAGLPLLYVDEPTFSGATRVVKRTIDLGGAGIGLLLLGFPLLVIAGLIRVTSPGSALFRQVRIGRDGKEFHVFKFRSMYQDSEDSWAGLMDENETDGLLFKMSDDPRVTRVGKFLRRASIDELPQLVNVLRGQMSLVGPRPLAVDDSEMEGHIRRRLLVRPGMTGLWQVSGRKDLSWDEAVRLDLYYVENWSLSMDFTVLMRTVLAVWRGEGAY
jgi:exopolysaccharide biosynthesis polyprenyl glycosylphosphotransferase